MATKNEKKSFDKLARIGCILCRTALGVQDSPAELHHYRRFGQPRSASDIIPLCPEHHRGNTGVHGLGRKGFENKWGVTQDSLLEKVHELLNE
jgi:hypothetical protein